MHASSFDTHLDEPSYWMGSEAGRATPGNVFYESDDESAASYVTGIFLPVDPDSLRDAASQTPGFARMQTMEVPPALNRSHRTQTPRNVAMQTSNTSLHSIGAQTKRKSGSRADLLRSILLEVKDIKKQQGLDGSDVESIASDVTIRKETLEMLYRDVAALRTAGAHDNATTQTQQEQMTQTSLRLFPEGDAQMQARQERLHSMLTELKSMKGEGDDSTRPQSTAHSLADFDQRTPSRSLTRTTPARFESPATTPVPASRASATPTPAVNGYSGVRFAYPPETSHSMPALNQEFPAGGGYGRRRVTQEDLNAVSDRLDRLQNYQMPPRRQLPMAPLPPPPMPPPMMYVPPPPPPPPARRYRVRHFSRSYDDLDALSDESDYPGGRRGRRRRGQQSMGDVRGRYHLDDALEEAASAARELKRMSAKMKRGLREELSKHDF